MEKVLIAFYIGLKRFKKKFNKKGIIDILGL